MDRQRRKLIGASRLAGWLGRQDPWGLASRLAGGGQEGAGGRGMLGSFPESQPHTGGGGWPGPVGPGGWRNKKGRVRRGPGTQDFCGEKGSPKIQTGSWTWGTSAPGLSSPGHNLRRPKLPLTEVGGITPQAEPQKTDQNGPRKSFLETRERFWAPLHPCGGFSGFQAEVGG